MTDTCLICGGPTTNGGACERTLNALHSDTDDDTMASTHHPDTETKYVKKSGTGLTRRVYHTSETCPRLAEAGGYREAYEQELTRLRVCKACTDSEDFSKGEIRTCPECGTEVRNLPHHIRACDGTLPDEDDGTVPPPASARPEHIPHDDAETVWVTTSSVVVHTDRGCPHLLHAHDTPSKYHLTLLAADWSTHHVPGGDPDRLRWCSDCQRRWDDD